MTFIMLEVKNVLLINLVDEISDGLITIGICDSYNRFVYVVTYSTNE